MFFITKSTFFVGFKGIRESKKLLKQAVIINSFIILKSFSLTFRRYHYKL